MSTTRIAILGLAIGSALLAVFLARGFIGKKPEKQVVEINKVETTDVLVVGQDIKLGDKLTPAHIAWQPWPKAMVRPHMITRKTKPEAKTELEGSRTRAELFQGEPISEKKLILPGSSGFMAAMLPKGMRAISVKISAQTGVGGFILPNDKVDVILTKNVRVPGSRNRTISERVLTNVRVLAIGQTFSQNEKGEQVVVGKTATMELNPRQAEVLALVETTGQLTLALRSLADRGDSQLGDDRPVLSERYAKGGHGGEITVLRYGVERQTATNE